MNRPGTIPPSARLALSLLILAFPALAAPPDVVWTSTFGGADGDQGWAVAPTGDGGFALAGTHDPTGAGVEDAYLVKIDDGGRRLWERTYGGAAKDAARAVLQTADGGFVLAGDTGVPPTAFDLLVIRTDADGDPVWETVVGGIGREEGRGVCRTSDGGFVVCGDSHSAGAGNQIYLVKFDADGDVVWERRLGGGDDHAFAVRETADRGFAVCGYRGDGATFPEFDALVLKVGAAGNLVWQRTLDTSLDDRAHDLRVLPDGDIVAGGISNGLSLLWRLSAGGATRWSQVYDAGGGQAFAVEVSPHGGFYLAGFVWAYENGAYQITVRETDAQGVSLSRQSIGGHGWELARGIALGPDRRLVVTGSTNSEGAGGYDVYAVGLDIGAVSGVADLPGPAGDRLAAAPNPFNPRVKVTFSAERPGRGRLEIHDLRGRHVATLFDGQLSAGPHDAFWDGRDRGGRAMPTGTYLLRLRTDAGVTTHKVALVR